MTTPATPKPTWAKRPDPSRRSTAATHDDPTDALIRSQAERTTNDGPATAPKQPTKHISLNMDAGLHKRLKLYCAHHERNVSELLSDLAKTFLSQNEA